MTIPYLIAHKVRSAPAFDVAIRMDCPECETKWREGLDGTLVCDECDSLGYWWIIPTSGHRAYPYWEHELSRGFSIEDILAEIDMPPTLRDHYIVAFQPSAPRPSSLSALLARPALSINRRGR